MPDTPTFGRYAELPYEQMRPEQQSRRGFRTARSRHSAIYAMRPLAIRQLGQIWKPERFDDLRSGFLSRSVAS